MSCMAEEFRIRLLGRLDRRGVYEIQRRLERFSGGGTLIVDMSDVEVIFPSAAKLLGEILGALSEGSGFPPSVEFRSLRPQTAIPLQFAGFTVKDRIARWEERSENEDRSSPELRSVCTYCAAPLERAFAGLLRCPSCGRAVHLDRRGRAHHYEKLGRSAGTL